MGVFTAAGKNALLNEIDGLGWYIAPFNGGPSGAGTEVSSSTTEGRIALDAKLGTAASGTVSNSAAITWTATGTITVNHVAIFSAASGGTLLGFDSVESQTADATETIGIAIGGLDFNLTDPA